MQLSGIWRRRLLVAAASVAVLVAAWGLFGVFAVPRILRSLLLDTVHERLHRELKVGEIHFNPFILELRISDANLPDADGSTLVAFKQLIVNAELLPSLVLRGASLSALEVDGLIAHATIRKNGQINLTDLALLAGPATGDKRPARLQVDRLAVTSGEIDFRELDHPAPFARRLRPIRFELKNFGTLQTKGNDYHFTARSEAGESLDWSGELFLEPFRSNGQFRIGALLATTVASYLGDRLPFGITSGVLDLAGSYEAAASEGSLQLKAAVSQLDIADIGLKARAATQDYVYLEHIRVSGAQADISKREASVARVEVNGGKIGSWLTPTGSLNLAELAGPATTAAAPATTAATRPAWRYEIADIALAGLAVDAEDRGVEPAAQLHLSDIAVGIKGYSSDDSRPLGLSLALKVNDSGQLASQGDLTLRDTSFKGKLTLTDIDLTPLQPYLQRDTDMTLLSGRLGAQLDVERSATGSVTAHGDAEVHDLRSIDNFLHQDFVKWNRLQARGVDLRAYPRRLRIRELIATEPYARVVVGGDRILNITHVLNPPGRAKSAPQTDGATKAPAKPAAASDIAIDVMRIQKGSANFSDLWIKPNFAVGLVDLSGTAKGLSSKADSRATVDLRGTVDHYAPALISGEINPLSATAYSDLTMSFHNIDMSTVTPYSDRFAGYQIRKGKLSAELTYKIKDRKLDAGHHFIIDQLELGEHVESPDATSLPVRLAVALLKDRQGLIDINLPVTGNLDDPQFRVAPLVWKAFFNLVAKVVTSPFTLLGNLFGGHDERVNQINFTTGTAVLDDISRQRLESMRKALIERPGLELEVPAAWSPELDRTAMLQRQLEARLGAVASKAGPDRYRQLLAAYREDAGAKTALPPLTAAYEGDRKRPGEARPPAEATAELEAALLGRLVVGDDELEELGKSRAAAMQDVLFAGSAVDPARVFVVNAAPASADAKLLRVDLRLK